MYNTPKISPHSLQIPSACQCWINLSNLASKDQLEMLIWNEEMKEYVKQNRELQSNLVTIFTIMWGQCSEAMKAKVKLMDKYEEKSAENDCTWLLQQIRAVTLQFDSKRNPFLSLLDAQASFLSYRQGQHQTPDSYLDMMCGWVEMIESYGGTVVENI